MNPIHFDDLGVKDYKETWDMQENILSGMLLDTLAAKYAGHLLFVEHPHVYTLGKSGNEANLLISEPLLKQKGAQFYRINRGGDITYHGPGQLVGYPILRLDHFGLGLRAYINNLEETIIQTLSFYNVEAGRLDGATGVWLDTASPSARKICAIGVRVSRQVTMHGFAFNVNTDLSYYNLINPCGFVDKGVTSLEKELGYTIDMGSLKKVLLEKLLEVFKAYLIGS
ncbi:MAG TPA: lipoyl(octanoyl) transferase LipB [Bacteroidales bacterium]|nr:lipoyl(octanoyl) transferase LipB [Bacteroidales bacterium]